MRTHGITTLCLSLIHIYPRLLQVMQEKDALYMKDPFTEEDGNRAAELEAEFAEMGGWDAETEAGQLLNGLGLDADAIRCV